MNIAYGDNLNSNYNSYNTPSGMNLYDSFGIRIPRIPDRMGMMKVYLVIFSYYPNYPFLIVG